MTFKVDIDENTKPLGILELTRAFNKISGLCIDCKRSKFTKEYDCEDCMTKEKLKDLIEDVGEIT